MKEALDFQVLLAYVVLSGIKPFFQEDFFQFKRFKKLSQIGPISSNSVITFRPLIENSNLINIRKTID